MNKKLLFWGLALAAGPSQISHSQLIDGHGYLVGDYVEVGINSNGYEGAPCLDILHCRSGVDTLIGFVANPQEDDWVEYNGDFFLPGAAENGFGIGYIIGTDTTIMSASASGIDFESAITGSITDYYDTADSTIITWDGVGGDLDIQIIYEIQKDQHFYTTTVNLNNSGTEILEEVFYYRNLDADNNQSIGGGFVTTNELHSQSGMVDDSVIVSSSQTTPWDSDFFFEADGEEWRGYIGGFFNRNPWHMWLGEGDLITTEGYTHTSDEAIGLVHRTEEILPGKTMAASFSFASVFKKGAVQEANSETNGLDKLENLPFTLYPNPSNEETVLITISGEFTYTVTDANGRVLAQGTGMNSEEVGVAEWESGFYFVEIQQENRRGVQKLVVSH